MITASRTGGWQAGLAIAEALADERRRIAADVHDLIMQDLSFALATARTLAARSGLGIAGERGGCRGRTCSRGRSRRDRGADRSRLHAGGGGGRGRCANRGQERAADFDAKGVATSAQPDQLTLETLVHVGREAVTNAVKHAAPSFIEVRFVHADEWRLQVRDRGRGFDPASVAGGFGLGSMRRHALMLGGSLHVASAPELRGTLVEVVLP